MEPVRILLVDDEKALLTLLSRHLERAGYTVVAALSAELALASLQETPDWEPALLIADETLPGETGTNLAIQLMERFPRLVSLLCSGYPLFIESLPPHLRKRAAILQKPYLPPMLESAITDLLSGAARP